MVLRFLIKKDIVTVNVELLEIIFRMVYKLNPNLLQWTIS
jgi:hypothetical protein